MRDMTRTTVALAALLASPAAWALPWNIDMVDADMFKAYEQEMSPLPEGVMSQEHLLTPVSFRQNYAWTDMATINGLENPSSGDDVLATGARMYEIYCWPCHGDGVELGPVGQPGRYPAVAVLAGDAGRLQNLSDGWVYQTIRNGSLSKLMPAYGYAMTNDEMWAIVAWMRDELPNSSFTPPEPAAAEEAN